MIVKRMINKSQSIVRENLLRCLLNLEARNWIAGTEPWITSTSIGSPADKNAICEGSLIHFVAEEFPSVGRNRSIHLSVTDGIAERVYFGRWSIEYLFACDLQISPDGSRTVLFPLPRRRERTIRGFC